MGWDGWPQQKLIRQFYLIKIGYCKAVLLKSLVATGA